MATSNRAAVSGNGWKRLKYGGELVEVVVSAKVFENCHRSFTTLQDDIHLIFKVE